MRDQLKTLRGLEAFYNSGECPEKWKKTIEDAIDLLPYNDFFIRDKNSGHIHRYGDDQHDSIWVDGEGTLHYSNLQNGDGCSSQSILDEDAGYEFCPCDYGEIDADYWEQHKDDYEQWLKRCDAL